MFISPGYSLCITGQNGALYLYALAGAVWQVETLPWG